MNQFSIEVRFESGKRSKSNPEHDGWKKNKDTWLRTLMQSLSTFNREEGLPWLGDTREERQYESVSIRMLSEHYIQCNQQEMVAFGEWEMEHGVRCESPDDIMRWEQLDGTYLGSSRSQRCRWGWCHSGWFGNPGPPSGEGGAYGNRWTLPLAPRQWSTALGFHGTPERPTGRGTGNTELWFPVQLTCFTRPS